MAAVRLSLVPADTLPLEQLAATFTAGYEGYVVPVSVDAASLGRMVASWDVDLRRSWVALHGRRPVGLALLGVRGELGWVGGLGVAVAARRRGLGRRLMDALLERAPPTVTLEVIEQNEPAIRLYETLGFERTRVLDVWSLHVQPAAAPLDPVPVATAREVLRRYRRARPPWQLDDRSLDEAGLEALATEDGAVLFRGADGAVSVLQLEARDPSAAAELLAAGRSRGTSLRYVNVPQDDPGAAALRELGAVLDLRQLELTLTAPTSEPRC